VVFLEAIFAEEPPLAIGSSREPAAFIEFLDYQPTAQRVPKLRVSLGLAHAEQTRHVCHRGLVETACSRSNVAIAGTSDSDRERYESRPDGRSRNFDISGAGS